MSADGSGRGCAVGDALVAALQSSELELGTNTAVLRCTKAAMPLINKGNYNAVMEAFESETKSIWDPNDFRPGMGKKRLTMLYVIDSLCIGNSKSEQIPTETRQELVDTFSARLPSLVQRLSTPCNCDKIEMLLEGWSRRDKPPIIPGPKVKDAKQRLQPSLQMRRETMATRVAAKFVQTAQGTGAGSYLPLDKIPCLYGSFIPKLPSESTRHASAKSLAFGVSMLKDRLGEKYTPQSGPPSSIRFLNACVGKFEASVGEDVATAEWMWADEEEIAHRKRNKINPPPVVHDKAALAAAKDFMSNAQGKGAVSQADVKPSVVTNTDDDTQLDAPAVEPGNKRKRVTPEKKIPGLGTWETVAPDENEAGAEHGDAADASTEVSDSRIGKFAGLKLTGASETTVFADTASPKPVSWLQHSVPPSPPYGHEQRDTFSTMGSLVPPGAPQYGGDAYAVDIFGADAYGAQQYNSYYGADDYYLPPLPSEPYEEEEPPPLPDEPPPPLPDEPPPTLDAAPPEELLPPPPQAQPLPGSPPPPLPDEPPPPLPDEPYEEHLQGERAVAPPPAPPPPLAPLRRPPSDTESGELVDSGTPTPRREHTQNAAASQAPPSAAAKSHHTPSPQLRTPAAPSAPKQPPPSPSPPGAQQPVAQPTAPLPVEPELANASPTPPNTSVPVHTAQPLGIPQWLPGDLPPTPPRSDVHADMHHAVHHSHASNTHAGHAHAMLQPPHPEAQWDVRMHGAVVPPAHGNIAHEPFAQHVLPPPNGQAGFADPAYAAPGMPGQPQQHSFLMAMPPGHPQHSQPAQLAMHAPPGDAHRGPAGAGGAFYPPGHGMPGWNNDREYLGHQSPLPDSIPNSRTPSPFPGAPPAHPPAPPPPGAPPSNSSNPLPGPPGAVGSQGLPGPPGPPAMHGLPPVAPPPGAPPPPHPDMPGVGWSNMGGMGAPGPNGSIPGVHGQPVFSRPPANGMLAPGQWAKSPGQPHHGAAPQRSPQKAEPAWR